MSSKAEREKRKARLLSEIQQQRLDLTACRRDWIETTDVYDRGWNTFLSLRSWALVGSSALAVWGVRHPSRLIRIARRGLGVWSLWRLVKSTLDQQRR
ncbi:YqjK-like family protein [Phytobacter sp. V91]|uniref:YqjK-like family protein n=1 Tax=Phytobacter sp. V91 TaxID=3369425 RepID=UPI003F62DD21